MPILYSFVPRWRDMGIGSAYAPITRLCGICPFCAIVAASGGPPPESRPDTVGGFPGRARLTLVGVNQKSNCHIAPVSDLSVLSVPIVLGQTYANSDKPKT